MSILIKGMEMPKEGYVDVRIKCNGTASFAIADNPYFKAVEAVPVPPHGRLIDEDALLLRVDIHGTNKFGMLDDDIRKFIKDTPTIIPAEEGE